MKWFRPTAKETALAKVQDVLDKDGTIDRFVQEIGGVYFPARDDAPAYDCEWGMGGIWDPASRSVFKTIRKGEIGIQIHGDTPSWGVWKIKDLAAELTTPQLKLF